MAEKLNSTEENQAAEQNAPNQWDALKDNSEQKDQKSPQETQEKLLKRAELYKKFGKVAMAMAAIEQAKQAAAQTSETDPPEQSIDTAEALQEPETVQAEALITQLENALDSVDQSLENQLDYNIVNHKQINNREALEQELQSGSAVPELDIRFDKDGKPWISHSPRAGARFLVSKHIHELSSDQVEKIGKRLSLEEGLDIIKKYMEDNPNHRIVLEIKELGASPDSHPQLLDNIQKLLSERGLTDSATFATLSPSILKSIHQAFPENSKILNGGIAPIISYDLAERSQGTEKNREFALKIPGVELFFSNSEDVTDHADGYGKQTGYLWTRLPKETVKTLRKLNEDGKIGAASLTVVNKFANILDKISPKTSEKIRRHYAAQLDELGIRKQVAISKSNPRDSLLRTKEQMGQDSIIYSDVSPGDFAADLPPVPEH